MFMPTMNSSRVQRVKVPYLSGGINPGSVGEAVSDNQLTDCLNVWFKGGEVVTRPKLVSITKAVSEDFDVESMQSVYSRFDGKKIKFSCDKRLNFIIQSADNSIFDTGRFEIEAQEDITFLLYTGTGKIKHSTGVFLLLKYDYTDGETLFHNKLLIEFYYENGDCKNSVSEKVYDLNDLYIPQVIINGTGNFNANLPRTDDAEYPKATQLEGFNLLTGAYKCTFTTDSISQAYKLPIAPDGKIKISVNTLNMCIGDSFCFCQYGEKSITIENIQGGFYKKNSDGTVTKVNTLEFTIEDEKDTANEIYYIDGRYIWYSADGTIRKELVYYRNKFQCKVDRNTGYISFPFMLQDEPFLYKASAETTTDKFTGLTLNATPTYNLEDTSLKISVNTTGAYVVSFNSEINGENVNMHTEGEYNTYFLKVDAWKNKSNLAMPRNGSIGNNMEVIVYNSVDESNFDKIVNCNVSEYYGGTVGLNHGTRSFVSGKDNYIYFSDVDNPLYFPENCYFGIGASGEKVTALSKQGGYLVIFKKNSIYCTYETKIENENSSEDLENQVIVDITAQYMYRIMSVNSEIGCDLPDTIQLCMNKLIFANSDGNVYVLNSLSNYSERNIFVVSGLIKDKLKKYEFSDWKAAFAVDYQGYYMIFVDDMGFVLNYNKNSYKYVGSYTTDSNVQKYGLFSWWIWQFPKYLKFGISTDNNISLILSQDGTFELCSLSDEPETECESYIVSKFFDFDMPDAYKGIERLQIDMGNDYDSTVWLEHLTDAGNDIINEPIEIYQSGERGKATYSRGRVNYPKIRLCRKYGFKISADGPMALSSVIINYSVKGSVKNGI